MYDWASRDFDCTRGDGTFKVRLLAHMLPKFIHLAICRLTPSRWAVSEWTSFE